MVPSQAIPLPAQTPHQLSLQAQARALDARAAELRVELARAEEGWERQGEGAQVRREGHQGEKGWERQGEGAQVRREGHLGE